MFKALIFLGLSTIYLITTVFKWWDAADYLEDWLDIFEDDRK